MFPNSALKAWFPAEPVIGTYALDDLAFAEGGVASSQAGYDFYVHKWDGGTTGSLALHVTSIDAGGAAHGFFRATAPGQEGHAGESVELCGEF
jgi:hypothetical protein